MCSIDFKDSYFTIRVKYEDRKYLKFVYNEPVFQFTALPFGVSICPYVYTKVMKPALALFRTKGIRITNYLDDFLNFGETINECRNNTLFVKIR